MVTICDLNSYQISIELGHIPVTLVTKEIVKKLKTFDKFIGENQKPRK